MFFHHPGIRIEMIASEPDVVDPVALTFDAEGVMYVVEIVTILTVGLQATRRHDSVCALMLQDLQESHLFAEQLSYQPPSQPTRRAFWWLPRTSFT